jgi:hypothetical protein
MGNMTIRFFMGTFPICPSLNRLGKRVADILFSLLWFSFPYRFPAGRSRSLASTPFRADLYSGVAIALIIDSVPGRFGKIGLKLLASVVVFSASVKKHFLDQMIAAALIHSRWEEAVFPVAAR